MKEAKLRAFFDEILSSADIVINGERPWDIKVHDQRFYSRAIKQGSLGVGEAYMDGWWDCQNLDEFFYRVMPVHAEDKIKRNLTYFVHFSRCIFRNNADRSRAFHVGERHYDIGNELYRRMLDKKMIYSCGYWRDAANLDEAQEAKLDLICKKLAIKAGQRVLDIGCGWGGFSKFAAEKYGVEVLGITVSKEQAEFAAKTCSGLPVEIRLADYRDITDRFDHIVSVGMFEHVGYKNYRTYMETVHSCLKEDGLFLLHTIGSDWSQRNSDPWYDRYIFPNSHLPSMQQISAASERLFVTEDWHNIGPYYYPTLMSWFRNFESSWSSLRVSYDEQFYRMWKYYLLGSAGTFRSRSQQVWQIVFSKKGIPGGYTAER
jgi:cyclopropane-fatty-acyl-phospholipid synthase